MYLLIGNTKIIWGSLIKVLSIAGKFYLLAYAVALTILAKLLDLC